MVSGKYFNKGVMALDAPHIGHVVRETDDKIVVFGGWSERYDIPISEIQTTGRNVLIGLSFHDIAKNYKVDRDAPLPTSKPINPWTIEKDVDLATYEGKYPNSLFNKGVRTNDEEHIGHVMKETDDKIVVFGHHNYRFDVPKSKIIAVGRNVILDMTYPEVFKYKVDIDAPLPTGEAIEKLVKEEKEKEKESLISSAKR
jgi:sporulation protein YlmC with PRC-barrel domain